MDPIDIMKSYKNWAVIASNVSKEKYGYRIYKKLKEKEYNVFYVCATENEIDGDKVYHSLSELPEKPEVVNFVINPRKGIDYVNECAKLGIDKIWLQPGTISKEILDLAAQKNIKVIENCVLIVSNYL